MSHTLKRIFYFLILPYIFFFLGNGVLGLTHPDEVFYVQTAREMIQQKSWFVPYLFGGPNFEKPIMTYWLLMTAFILCGVSSFSARFFPAFFALIGILGIYSFGKYAFKKEDKGLYAGMILMSSMLYIGLARTVFTDMFVTVFIELSLMAFYWAYTNPRRKTLGILLFWFFSGLAVLTKGIPGVSIPVVVVTVFLFIRKDLKFIFCKSFWWGLALFGIVVLPWYGYVINTFGRTFIDEFYYNDHIRRILEAEHQGNDRWFFYPFSMVAFMAPWSIFVVLAAAQLYKKIKGPDSAVHLFLVVWIAGVFCTFQFAHSKLVSYIFPLFPAVALITGDFVSDFIHDPRSRKWFFISSLFLSVVIFAAAVLGLTIYSEYVPSRSTMFSTLLLSCAVLIVTCVLLLKTNNAATRMAMVMIQIPFLLAFCLWNHSAFENYVSSKNPSQYLLSNYQVNEPILCSKSFLRATRFHTDKKVVMLNLYDASKFFSPHPVHQLKSEKDVIDFINSKPNTYGVLTKHAVRDLQEFPDHPFQLKVLAVFGDEYLVELKPNVQKVFNKDLQSLPDRQQSTGLAPWPAEEN